MIKGLGEFRLLLRYAFFCKFSSVFFAAFLKITRCAGGSLRGAISEYCGPVQLFLQDCSQIQVSAFPIRIVSALTHPLNALVLA